MSLQPLRVSLVQGATRWHDAPANRDYYGALVRSCADSDLIVLPETFLSGFSNDVGASAETMDGEGVAWLKALAEEMDAVLCGSLAIRGEDGRVYNRLLWMRPDGSFATYDKRHLFRMAGEHTRYGSGRERLIVELDGWRVLPQVCYDLRFPVWLRNRRMEGAPGGMDYDLSVFVANWPAPRREPWRVLLRARAIENLSYVVGVNRVGVDGNGLAYAGDSAAIDPQGQMMIAFGAQEQVATVTLDPAALLAHRERFPAWMDADAFTLQLP
jgi:predicted amidohydrolase